jgi:hypothetical protein
MATMSTTTRQYLTGTIAAAVVACALTAWLWGQLNEIWNGSGTVYEAQRPLIVFSTSGADRTYELRVLAEVEENGRLSMTFGFPSEEISYEEGWAHIPVDYTLTYVSADGTTAMSCPDGSDFAQVDYASLDKGTRAAVDLDLAADKQSALKVPPGATLPSPSAPEDPDSYGYWEANGSSMLIERDTVGWNRLTSDDGAIIWVEECVIEPPALWHDSEQTWFERGARTSLLVPQINLVDSSGTVTHQGSIDMYLSVARPSRMEALNAFPQFDTSYSGWTRSISSEWASSASLHYTPQSALVLQEVDSQQRKEVALLLYGAVSGMVGAAFVAAISNAVAFLSSRHRDRMLVGITRRPDTEDLDR